MRLHRAALHFDDSVIYDAYNNSLVGNGQLDPTDIFKLDGASVRRRVLSVSPQFTPPARRAIKLGADYYLMGEPSTDEWRGSPIRTKYVLHQTPSQATIKTIAEALANSAGTTAYASREWNKDVADMQESSDYFNDYHIFVASNEGGAEGSLIYIDSEWHYIHAVHPSLSGFKDLVSHEIPSPVFETVNISSNAYNPVTDSFASATTNVKVLRLRWKERFKYKMLAQETYQRGDETLVVLKSVIPTLKVGDTIPLSDGTRRVLAVRDDGTTLSVHARV